MKVRDKQTKWEGTSSTFNTSSPAGEVIVHYIDGDGDSVFIRDLEVLINGKWIDMAQAFKYKLLIRDNYNTQFREPLNEEEKERGWY